MQQITALDTFTATIEQVSTEPTAEQCSYNLKRLYYESEHLDYKTILSQAKQAKDDGEEPELWVDTEFGFPEILHTFMDLDQTEKFEDSDYVFRRLRDLEEY